MTWDVGVPARPGLRPLKPSHAHDRELHRVGEGFKLQGKVTHAQGNMMGRALLAPAIEELVQGPAESDAAVWITDRQDAAWDHCGHRK